MGGGDGTRAGGPLPKQFQEIEGKQVLLHASEAFLKADSATTLFVVIHPEFLEEWEETAERLEREFGTSVYLVCGGKSRRQSVANALMMIREMEMDSNALVAVHDGARPLVGKAMIDEGYNMAKMFKAVIPVVPLTDSIRRRINNEESISENRADFVAVQTPQIFTNEIIQKAYSMPEKDNQTDDASIVEAAGNKIHTFPGNIDNIKITNPIDFKIAAQILMESK